MDKYTFKFFEKLGAIKVYSSSFRLMSIIFQKEDEYLAKMGFVCRMFAKTAFCLSAPY